MAQTFANFKITDGYLPRRACMGGVSRYVLLVLGAAQTLRMNVELHAKF